jgi:ABC-type branched-subunit amino acid transport system ATPase component
LIGPNGSGKTTLFNCITGFLHPDTGNIRFNGVEITDNAPYKISRLGIARTFQLVRIFPELSVLENMLIAIQDHQERSVFSRIFRSPSVRKNERFAIEKALDLLNFVGLEDFRNETAKNLSYGQRKLLTFVLALMPEPDLVLLDEPAAAVNPTMINHIKQHIRDLNDLGTTIFLIEHNMDVVMDLADRIIVLDYGSIIAEGKPEEIKENEKVIEAYFGH